MAVLILVVTLTIFISSQCSLYEATLYSTRMGTLEAERSLGKLSAKARLMIEMKRKISVPLSSILILNTLANTAGATIAGMYAHKALGSVWVPLFSVAFTLGILFLAEIIPKTLGAVYWRSFWPHIVLPLTLMKYLLYPAIIITQWLSDRLTRKATGPSITEEDILGTIQLGAKYGELSHWESLMLHNIIGLETRQVKEIMTPRTVMFTLNETLTLIEGFEAIRNQGFSRIPLFRGEKENLVGYVMTKDLCAARIENPEELRLKDLAKPILVVEESRTCLMLLTEFIKTKRQIAVVWDPYGGVAGLVTMEDLLETVLGAEIVDETDPVADLQKLARQRWEKRRKR